MLIGAIVFVGDSSRGVLFPILSTLNAILGGSNVDLGYLVAMFSIGYICMHNFMNRMLYGYMYVYSNVHTYLCIYIHIYIYVYICIYMYIYTYIHIYIYMYIHIYVDLGYLVAMFSIGYICVHLYG
jgi:hypothetical protein